GCGAPANELVGQGVELVQALGGIVRYAWPATSFHAPSPPACLCSSLQPGCRPTTLDGRAHELVTTAAVLNAQDDRHMRGPEAGLMLHDQLADLPDLFQGVLGSDAAPLGGGVGAEPELVRLLREGLGLVPVSQRSRPVVLERS